MTAGCGHDKALSRSETTAELPAAARPVGAAGRVAVVQTAGSGRRGGRAGHDQQRLRARVPARPGGARALPAADRATRGIQDQMRGGAENIKGHIHSSRQTPKAE